LLPTRLAPGRFDEDLTETIQVLGAVCEKIFRERRDHITLCKSKRDLPAALSSGSSSR